MGVWTYAPPNPKGGRPSHLFALTMPPEVLEPMARLATRASVFRGSAAKQRLAREVIRSMNRYPLASCRQLADALTQVVGILTNLAPNDLPVPMFRRRICVGRSF
jgi:hypothetical protein